MSSDADSGSRDPPLDPSASTPMQPDSPTVGGGGDGGESGEDGPAEEARVGEIVEHPPPRMNTKPWRQLWRTRKYLKKREKLLGDGYVQWYLIGDSVNRPKFIKPERKGGGIPELDHDGETYLFPPDAKVPSADGMWVYIHRQGEADPINIRNPSRMAIDADELKEYLDLRVSASSPGFFDSLGIDAGDMIKLMIGLIIAYAVFQQVMGGGL